MIFFNADFRITPCKYNTEGKKYQQDIPEIGDHSWNCIHKVFSETHDTERAAGRMLPWKTKESEIDATKQKKNNIDWEKNYFQDKLVNPAIKKRKRVEMKDNKNNVGNNNGNKIKPDSNKKVFQ